MKRPEDINYSPAYQDAWSLAPGAKIDPASLNALKAEGMRTGPSKWAVGAKSRQDLLDLSAIDQANKSAAGRTATARSNLAMRGGVGSGTNAYLERQGMRDAMEQGQEIGRQGNLNRLGMDTQDEQNRLGVMSQLPGADIAIRQPELQANMFDVNQKTAEGARKNDFNLNKYDTQMKEWAGNQQAAAIAGSGKKGSLFGLGANGKK
jgi:hypothetical protein